jgi:hypothetical protein
MKLLSITGFSSSIKGLQWFITVLFVFRDNNGSILHFNLDKKFKAKSMYIIKHNDTLQF